MRSRVVLLTTVVAMAAVVATAWLATRNVESSLRDNVSQSLESDVGILQSLTDYAVTHPSWDGVDELVDSLARATGRRIALVVADDVVADSDEIAGRDPSPLPPAASAVIDPLSPNTVLYAPILVTGAVEAGIDTASVGIAASGSQTVIGVVPSDLGVRSAGVVVPSEPVATGQAVPTPAIDADTAPRAQLFLGRRADDPLSLSGDGRWRTFGIIGIVLAVAAAFAWVFGRQLTRPLDALAGAAHRVREGDLSGRVDVHARGELGEVARAFNSMASSLQQTQEQRRRMTSDIAHELRNPLVTINGTLEAIQDGVYQPDPDVIASLVDETDHLRALVDDLQQLALAESGTLVLEPVETPLADVVDQVLAAHRSSAAATGVELLRSGDDDVAAVVDPRRIRQVLANLVSNAVRHTPAGGSVTVALHRTADGGSSVRVSDTGEGIAADDLPHVFDRFWRADPSRSRERGGAGLGLAISHELVRLHGGTIEVESTVGVGTTFVVSVPDRPAALAGS